MARRTELIKIREGLELTQAEAAERIGFTDHYLRSIETGRVPLTDSALVKIARGYGVSVDDLMKRAGRNGRIRGAAA